MSELICSVCGKNAKVNTPGRTKDGEILCYMCVHDSPEIIQGIDQNTLEYVPDWTKGDLTLWKNKYQDGVHAWYNKGGTSFWLTEEEKKLPVEKIFALMEKVLASGKVRCTMCGLELPKEQVSSYLFAGISCPACTKIKDQQAKDEITKGQTCYKCGQPWSRCCC